MYCYLLPFIIIFMRYTSLHYRCPLYRVTPVLHVTHTHRKIPPHYDEDGEVSYRSSSNSRYNVASTCTSARYSDNSTRRYNADSGRYTSPPRRTNSRYSGNASKGQRVTTTDGSPPPPNRSRLTSLYRRTRRKDIDVAGLTGVLCSDLEDGKMMRRMKNRKWWKFR